MIFSSIIYDCHLWRIVFTILSFTFFEGCISVEIRRLAVPRYIQNGTKEYIVLDCEYVYNENDIRLVVKWFYEDNLEPFYQWIPELKRKHTSEKFKNRLDLNYSVSTVDDYAKFRALKISKPSIELSGKYTCLVSSLAGQDSKEQVMTIYVPAHEFQLSYLETRYKTVNVSCEALGVYPSPLLKLYVSLTSGSPPQIVTEVKFVSVRTPSGAYDVLLQRTFKISELSTATVFECKLELPGTNYAQAKSIAYFPGIQGPRIGSPYELSSDSSMIKNSNILLIVYLLWCVRIIFQL